MDGKVTVSSMDGRMSRFVKASAQDRVIHTFSAQLLWAHLQWRLIFEVVYPGSLTGGQQWSTTSGMEKAWTKDGTQSLAEVF